MLKSKLIEVLNELEGEEVFFEDNGILRELLVIGCVSEEEEMEDEREIIVIDKSMGYESEVRKV